MLRYSDMHFITNGMQRMAIFYSPDFSLLVLHRDRTINFCLEVILHVITIAQNITFRWR